TMSPSIMGTWLYGPCFYAGRRLQSWTEDEALGPKWQPPEVSKHAQKDAAELISATTGRDSLARGKKSRPGLARTCRYLPASLCFPPPLPPSLRRPCCHAGLVCPGLVKAGRWSSGDSWLWRDELADDY